MVLKRSLCIQGVHRERESEFGGNFLKLSTKGLVAAQSFYFYLFQKQCKHNSRVKLQVIPFKASSFRVMQISISIVLVD